MSDTIAILIPQEEMETALTKLLKKSIWFEVTPFPEEKFEVKIKNCDMDTIFKEQP